MKGEGIENRLRRIGTDRSGDEMCKITLHDQDTLLLRRLQSNERSAVRTNAKVAPAGEDRA